MLYVPLPSNNNMSQNRDLSSILSKLKIDELNKMQVQSMERLTRGEDLILLSPTGTGKTLAFLIPIILKLDPDKKEIQTLIIAPARELVIQIENVAREIGSGYKINAVYGGQMFSKDKINLKHRPAILIGTPGRLADHFRRETFSTAGIKTLVLDEFDKSLEIGFEDDMIDIYEQLDHSKQTILTSATTGVSIPPFVRSRSMVKLDFLTTSRPALNYKLFSSPDKDKLETLVKALCHLGLQRGIVFCNYKESITRISEKLEEYEIPHDSYHGSMEQHDRERTILKFRNSSTRVIIATDLAARGLDIPEIDYIIHYHLPHRAEEFIHRNGRTARMNTSGTIYILSWSEEELPDFIPDHDSETLSSADIPPLPVMKTLYVSGGRKDKISKGDLAGLFMKQAELEKDELGIIEIKDECAFVAVTRNKAELVAEQLNNARVKKRKVRVYTI